MPADRRKPEGPGFGHDGGSNLSDYLGAAGHAQQIELLAEAGERLVQVSVDRIDTSPYQARTNFDPEEIAALGMDIREHGLNHPVTVRPKQDGRYELVTGERRWLAARKVGLAHVTARVRSLDDFEAHLIGVSENNQRADLSAWEMAVEAAELLQHAQAASRPHSQRDLARYLNRNVAIVNQQLSIAAAFGPDLLTQTQTSRAMLCRLPHIALHEIAKMPASRRPPALKEAIRRHKRRSRAANGEAKSDASTPQPSNPPPGDRWTQLWEQGGMHLQIRKPLSALDPGLAQKYLQQMVPAIGGLAARAAGCESAERVVQWEDPCGTLIFVRSTELLTGAERTAAREAFRRLLDALDTTSEPEVPETTDSQGSPEVESQLADWDDRPP